jgi:hypothetical protein
MTRGDSFFEIMRTSLPLLVCCIGLLPGCSLLNHFGYYKHEEARRASPEDAEKVRFPASFENGLRVRGPMLNALHVAMDDFLSAGRKFKGDDERIIQCLNRWDTFDTSVLQIEDLFFVSFIPHPSRCGIEEIIVDAGATYAIDATGQILDVR